LTDEEYDAGLRLLSGDERDRAARFVFDRDRHLFVAAHVLLRRALSEYEPVEPGAWAFAAGAHGKPALAGPHRDIPLRFNLAHTHGLVACALSRDADVGIDVEPLASGARSLDIADRFFSAAEAGDLRNCDPDVRHVRFTEIWTLKEAYIKAIGTGLSHPLASFALRFDGDARLRLESDGSDETARPSRWQFALFAPTPDHRMAVAVDCGPGERCRITAREDGVDRVITPRRRSDTGVD